MLNNLTYHIFQCCLVFPSKVLYICSFSIHFQSESNVFVWKQMCIKPRVSSECSILFPVDNNKAKTCASGNGCGYHKSTTTSIEMLSAFVFMYNVVLIYTFLFPRDESIITWHLFHYKKINQKGTRSEITCLRLRYQKWSLIVITVTRFVFCPISL
jgi:hypothetical protein